MYSFSTCAKVSLRRSSWLCCKCNNSLALFYHHFFDRRQVHYIILHYHHSVSGARRLKVATIKKSKPCHCFFGRQGHCLTRFFDPKYSVVTIFFLVLMLLCYQVGGGMLQHWFPMLLMLAVGANYKHLFFNTLKVLQLFDHH